MSKENLSNPFPCLLCQGLLPPDNEGIVTKHVAEQHNVFSRAEFIIMASKLMVEEVEQVEHLMKNILVNRGAKKIPDIQPYLESEIEESENIDNVEETKNADKDTKKLIKLEEVRTESKKKVVETSFGEVKNEDIMSNPKRKRMRVKACVVEGSCRCPICNKEFVVRERERERERGLFHSDGAITIRCKYKSSLVQRKDCSSWHSFSYA